MLAQCEGCSMQVLRVPAVPIEWHPGIAPRGRARRLGGCAAPWPRSPFTGCGSSRRRPFRSRWARRAREEGTLRGVERDRREVTRSFHLRHESRGSTTTSWYRSLTRELRAPDTAALERRPRLQDKRGLSVNGFLPKFGVVTPSPI